MDEPRFWLAVQIRTSDANEEAPSLSLLVGVSRAIARPPSQRTHALSGRERQVLTLMAEGLSNAEIAERLVISEKTVRNHASNIFDKLGVWSRAQAIVFARDRGYNG